MLRPFDDLRYDRRPFSCGCTAAQWAPIVVKFELIIIKLKNFFLVKEIIKFAKVRKSSNAKLRQSESSVAVHLNNISKQIS